MVFRGRGPFAFSLCLASNVELGDWKTLASMPVRKMSKVVQLSSLKRTIARFGGRAGFLDHLPLGGGPS